MKIKVQTISLIITAAGSGQRFGSPESKVLVPLLGKPVITHTLEQFSNVMQISHCVITATPGQELAIKSAISKVNVPFSVDVITGGKRRQDSVKMAVNELSQWRKATNTTMVLIHDGARPHVSSELMDRLFSSSNTCDAVIPVIPVTDTIKQVDSEGMVVNTLDRGRLRAVQTPQLFSISVLKSAYEQGDDGEFTDEAMLVERHGISVKTVDGDVNNIKLTYPVDLERLVQVKGCLNLG